MNAVLTWGRVGIAMVRGNLMNRTVGALASSSSSLTPSLASPSAASPWTGTRRKEGVKQGSQPQAVDVCYHTMVRASLINRAAGPVLSSPFPSDATSPCTCPELNSSRDVLDNFPPSAPAQGTLICAPLGVHRWGYKQTHQKMLLALEASLEALEHGSIG